MEITFREQRIYHIFRAYTENDQAFVIWLQSTFSPKCSTWMQSQKRQNDLSSFPRQTTQHHSKPSLCPGKFGHGVQNEAGQRLTGFCQENARSLQTPSFNNTRDDSTHGHHRMVNTWIRLIIFFAAKDGEALYSQQKQDLNWLWLKSLLQNSDLNWRK